GRGAPNAAQGNAVYLEHGKIALATTRRGLTYDIKRDCTSARRLPARLPRYLRHHHRSTRRAGDSLLCPAGPPGHSGLAVREGAPVSRARLSPRPAAIPASAGRPEGRRAVAAHLVGSGDRRDCDALEGDHRRVWRGCDPALLL